MPPPLTGCAVDAHSEHISFADDLTGYGGETFELKLRYRARENLKGHVRREGKSKGRTTPGPRSSNKRGVC